MAETGHVKNVENLQKAIGFATGWGANYAPSNPMLDIAAMTTLATTAEAALHNVQTNRTPYRNATAACDDLFDPLSKRTTCVMKALKASGVPDSVLEDGDTYARNEKGPACYGERSIASGSRQYFNVDVSGPAAADTPRLPYEVSVRYWFTSEGCG
jgi:hypothetical protein